MDKLQQYRTRPRLACEVTVEGVISARAADRSERLELFTVRRLAAGAVTPGLSAPNVHDGEALRSAVRGSLGAVASKIEKLCFQIEVRLPKFAVVHVLHGPPGVLLA